MFITFFLKWAQELLRKDQADSCSNSFSIVAMNIRNTTQSPIQYNLSLRKRDRPPTVPEKQLRSCMKALKVGNHSAVRIVGTENATPDEPSQQDTSHNDEQDHVELLPSPPAQGNNLNSTEHAVCTPTVLNLNDNQQQQDQMEESDKIQSDPNPEGENDVPHSSHNKYNPKMPAIPFQLSRSKAVTLEAYLFQKSASDKTKNSQQKQSIGLRASRKDSSVDEKTVGSTKSSESKIDDLPIAHLNPPPPQAVADTPTKSAVARNEHVSPISPFSQSDPLRQSSSVEINDADTQATLSINLIEVSGLVDEDNEVYEYYESEEEDGVIRSIGKTLWSLVCQPSSTTSSSGH